MWGPLLERRQFAALCEGSASLLGAIAGAMGQGGLWVTADATGVGTTGGVATSAAGWLSMEQPVTLSDPRSMIAVTVVRMAPLCDVLLGRVVVEPLTRRHCVRSTCCPHADVPGPSFNRRRRSLVSRWFESNHGTSFDA
jgi:hypothetical protein